MLYRCNILFMQGKHNIMLHCRAKSLQGVHLLSFDAFKIKTSEKVKKEMERLKMNMSFQQMPEPLALSHANWTEIYHINARGLLQHKENLLT